MRNILTVDCEDWFHTDVSQKYLRGESESLLENRIDSSVNILLELFQRYNAKATFFVLGLIVEKFPELIPRIEDKGHRIGAHGYDHTSVFLKTAVEFEKDVEKVTGILNCLATHPVVSFRAPNWSIGLKNLWAIEILKKYGYRYDSSLKRPVNIKKKFQESSEPFIEIPRSGQMIGGLQIPFGGAFFRLYPLKVMMYLMKEMNRKGKPFMVYVHPWEVDGGIPIIKTSWVDRIIQYKGILRNFYKIKMLLDSFEFVSIEEFFDRGEMDIKSLNQFCFFF